MKSYTFDFKLRGAVTVRASSETIARALVIPHLDCATASIDGMIEAEVSLDGDLELAQVDGKDV
jgi:hypothetical protein